MKLINKLFLSFSTVTLLLIVIAFLAWNAINNLNRQQQYILKTENMITDIADIRATGLEAVATTNPERLQQIGQLLQGVHSEYEHIKQLTTSERGTELINQIKILLGDFQKVYQDLNNAFAIVVKADKELTVIGTKANNLMVSLRNESLAENDTDTAATVANIKNYFILARLNIANYINAKTPENYTIAKNSLDEAIAFVNSVQTYNPKLEEIIALVKSYFTEGLPVLTANDLMQKSLTSGNMIVAKLLETSLGLSENARSIFNELKDSVLTQIAVCSCLAVLISILLSLFIGRNVMKQLGADPSELAQIAHDVTNDTFVVDENKTYTGVYKSITEMVLTKTEQSKRIAEAHNSMQQTAKQLEEVANIASSAMEQLSAQIDLSGQGAENQADQVASTATALEEMNATVLEIAKNAASTAEEANGMKQQANNGAKSMQECIDAMQEVKGESEILQTEMVELSKHAQAINEIMNVISDIADQTNLLALNAAIEAARAGEAGRGFAVVADEVRNLAEKTMASTTDVANAITAIQKSTQTNTQMVIDTVQKIEKITDMVNNTGIALSEITHLSDETADQIRAIATASEEQSATSEEITKSMESINLIAKENANNMHEAKIAINDMVKQTHIINSLIVQLQN